MQELNRQNSEPPLASSRAPEVGVSKAEASSAPRKPATLVENVNPVAANWVEAHGDYLFNFAVGQMRNANVAEDLVQETFLAALKSQDNFSGRSSERTWLVGILRHKIQDHLRKACRERAMRVESLAANDESESFDESLVWIHQIAAESTSPSRRIELAEFREHLEKAMSKLPPRIAQVFELYSIEECTNHEVCAQLNISESNLWVMLHRARKQLSEAFAGWRDFTQGLRQKSIDSGNPCAPRSPKNNPESEL
jgi:RNA polymerase sigma-70 factor (TIGR02943 family)